MKLTVSKDAARTLWSRLPVGALASLLLIFQTVHGADPVLLVASDSAQQEFKGLGISNRFYGGFDNTPADLAGRDQLTDKIVGDLKLTFLRVWIYPRVNKTPQQMVDEFASGYINSGQWAEFKKRGMNTLIGAPAGPTHAHPSTVSGYDINQWCDDIATFYQLLKQQHGIEFQTTGLANEPQLWSTAQIVEGVKKLRVALDNRGMQNLKIFAAEWASVDTQAHAGMDALKADSEAWAALGGIGIHSYGMAATTRSYNVIKGTDLNYWQTESCDPGREEPGNTRSAVLTATRLLNDLNHGVSHWSYFIGFMPTGFNDSDSGTKLAVWDNNLNQARYHLKYHYLKQLSQTFDVGSSIRRVTNPGRYNYQSSDLQFGYGNTKAACNAAVALNPDGSWAIGLTNNTGLASSPEAIFRPTAILDLTVEIPELAGSGNINFNVTRSSGSSQIVSEGVVTMVGGRVTVTVNPRDLVTLRSAANLPTLGVKGDYYDGRSFQTLAGSRNDATINFTSSTFPGFNVGSTDYSVRWVGGFRAAAAGTYSIRVTGDDGVRLFLGSVKGGVPVIDRWKDQGPTAYDVPVRLDAGQLMPFRLEYYQNSGGAMARLEWKRPGSNNYEVIPASSLFLPVNGAGATVPDTNPVGDNPFTVRLEAENYDAASGDVSADPNEPHLISLQQNWVRYDNLDLTGIDSLSANVAVGTTGKLDFRLGSPTGIIIASVNVSGTGSEWRTFKNYVSPVIPVSGTQTLYVVGTGNHSGVVDFIDLSGLNNEGQTGPLRLQVETYDGASGDISAEPSEPYLISLKNKWARYDNFDLTDVSSLTANVAVGTTGKLEFRIGSLTGTKIAEIYVSGSSSEWRTFKDYDSPVTSVTGPQTLYIIGSGSHGGLIDYVDFFSGNGMETPVAAPEPPAPAPIASGLDPAGWFAFGNDVTAYGDSQDGSNGKPTAVVTSADRTGATLSGNAWKVAPLNYEVTSNTWMDVTVEASNTGEIIGVSLDDDLLPFEGRRAFLFGPESVNSADRELWSWLVSPIYSANQGSLTYSIPVGSYFTGSVNYLGLIADDDANGATQVTYSDIRLYEVEPTPPSAQPISILTDADTFARGGSRAGDNFGNWSQLQVKGGTGEYNRVTYVRFDLSQLTGPATEANLVMHLQSVGGGSITVRPIEIRAVDDDNWFEWNLTMNNAPTGGALIQAFDVLNSYAGSNLVFDVTSYINSERLGDGVATFMIRQPDGPTALLRFSSRDTSDPPTLEID